MSAIRKPGAEANPKRGAIAKEYWSDSERRVWIATRSEALVRSLNGENAIGFPRALDEFVRGRRPPYPMTQIDALRAFAERFEVGPIQLIRLEHEIHHDGTFHPFKVSAHEMMAIWPIWPEAQAWNLAKSKPWPPEAGVAAVWKRHLPKRKLLSVGEVIDALALASDAVPIGASKIEEHAARLSICMAILDGAQNHGVKLLGVACERSQQDVREVRQIGSQMSIELQALLSLAPVLDGKSDWLGPVEYADNFGQDGHALKSVAYCNVVVERETLAPWLLKAIQRKLSRAEVKKWIADAQENEPGIGIDKIAAQIMKQHRGLTRAYIRRTAAEMGASGKRGRPRKKSADQNAPKSSSRILE